MHRLLQSLPGVAADARNDAAMRYLTQAAPEMTPLEQAALVTEALRVMSDPQCLSLFASGSRAEAELAARLASAGGKAIEISARLDRVLVSDDTVTFADFKSDSAIPNRLDEIPAHYVTQLAAYRAALAHAFPGKKLRALLIYTAGPRVFEVPEESLESAWLRLGAQGSAAFA
jgi:ATP-dependent helicase/nuclease subunit A